MEKTREFCKMILGAIKQLPLTWFRTLKRNTIKKEDDLIAIKLGKFRQNMDDYNTNRVFYWKKPKAPFPKIPVPLMECRPTPQLPPPLCQNKLWSPLNTSKSSDFTTNSAHHPLILPPKPARANFRSRA